MANDSNILLSKLDAFIRKYYTNQLIRGVIWVLGFVISALLLASVLEYFGRYSSTVRTALFITLLTFTLLIVTRLIIVPLLKLNKLGNRIVYTQAAKIVGEHFPEINDRLLNTLQLGADANASPLLKAAIEQKTVALKPIPFQNAIDFKSNRKYVKYAAIPLLLFAVIAMFNKGFTDSTKRIVQYNQEFEEQAPFNFELDMASLEVMQNEPVTIRMETSGEVIPAESYVNVGGNAFKMRSMGDGKFEYGVKRISENTNFYFMADGFNSESYELTTVPKPSMLKFETFLDYPAYTGFKDEMVRNTSELKIPVGTQIKWTLATENVDKTTFYDGETEEEANKNGKVFEFVRRCLNSSKFVIHTSNSRVRKGDSLTYDIQTIPDLYPEIKLEEQEDSNSRKRIYMMGEIKDDYGFSRLQFHYKFVGSSDDSKVGQGKSINIAIDPKRTSQGFYHYWDLNELDIQTDDKLEYYFEVWDNDGVHGSKSARTRVNVFAAPSKEQINAEVEKNTEEVKKDINDSKDDLKNLEKDIADLERKLTEKKKLTWEDKKKINQLLEDHKKLEEQLKDIVDQNTKNNESEKEFNQLDQQIMDKQEQIEELFDEVLNDEMKELMDQIQELMNQNQKDQMLQKLDELQMADEDAKKQLDRMLEQLKQLQLEKKVNETVEKLNKLAEEQKKLGDESEKGEKSSEELQKEQEKLTKEFEKVKKDLDDIDKKNKDLETPLDMDTKKMEEEKKNVDDAQEQSKQDLNKNQKSKAGQQQKKAGDEMKKMAQELNNQMQMAMQQQHIEDYNTLRGILDNLIQVSKDQEALMESFKETRGYNPRYVELGQEQKKIKDDAQIIEDSLFALSKRVQQVEHFINKEIGAVNTNIKKAIEHLGERRTHMVINHQQYVMTSMNNLALMLESSLEQMQQQMQSKPGSGQCSKPGENKKPGGAKSMREMQESLKKQLEQMGKQQQQGGKPSSKQFAKAAAQQAAIRKKLRELKKMLEKEGKGNSLGDLNKTETMMDDLERDLYNKRLNQNVLKRQQEILTRLLEHEKAERNQEKDNKRKSNEGKDINRPVPPSIEEYLKQKEKEQELLQTLPPDLSPYYKNKARDYFRELGK